MKLLQKVSPMLEAVATKVQETRLATLQGGAVAQEALDSENRAVDDRATSPLSGLHCSGRERVSFTLIALHFILELWGIRLTRPGGARSAS